LSEESTRVNLVDVVLFQATLSPDTLAMVVQGSVVPYGRLAPGIISAQQRLKAIGLKEGDIVALNIAHPIDHIVFACALYRMRITAACLEPNDPCFDQLECTAVLSDSANALIGIKQPSARVVIVNATWFQDQAELSVRDRSQSFHDPNPDWICRLSRDPGAATPTLVKQTARSFEAHIQACCVMAPPHWERMISIIPAQSNAGAAHAMSALYLGRTICFSDVGNVRQIAALYKHHYLVGTSHEMSLLAASQRTQYIPLPSLRGLLVEGQTPVDAGTRTGLNALCANAWYVYSHPQIGPVTLGNLNQMGNVEGAVGYVAPWCEVEITGHSGEHMPEGEPGILKMRRRRETTSSSVPMLEEEWCIVPQQQARFASGGLLAML
jgi:hypothetical protein